MSRHYADRMESDLGEIRGRVRRVSDLVEDQVGRAVRALFEHDRAGAAHVVLGDREVNRRIKEIDGLCHVFIVRHAPSEAYLRRASAVLRLDVALERIGDYASSVGREVGRLTGPPPEDCAQEIRAVADHARISLTDALRAFHEDDQELARSNVRIPDDEIEAVFRGLTTVADRGERSLSDVFGLTHILNLLMRVTEQSSNIREQTLFAITGERPEHDAFRVLFVDERNTRTSKLAEAYARDRYPRSGTYRSAGWKPGDAVEPDVVEFLGAKGLDLPPTAPTAFAEAVDRARPHHVVVVLGAEEGGSIAELPFRTTLLNWDLDAEQGSDVGELYAHIGPRIDELMKTLAGPEAA